MNLWRVDVGGVSHRFVEAESRAQAKQLVTASLLEGLDVVATPAHRVITQTYDAMGPRQRKRMLAALDGLASPRAERQGKAARRALARLVKFDLELRASAKAGNARQRPADPEVIAALLRHVEANSLAEVRTRLREYERRYYEDDEIQGSSLRR
jgi:hypothetical protein